MKTTLTNIFVLLYLFLINLSNNHLSFCNLTEEEYRKVITYFKTVHNITEFLSILPKLPDSKEQAYEYLRTRANKHSQTVEVVAMEYYGKHCSITTFIVHININETNSKKIKKFSCHYKPLYGTEYENLVNFLESGLKKLIDRSNFQLFDFGNDSCKDVYECYTFMPTTPLYTNLWGNQRRTWFRINRKIFPFISNPTDFQILVDHPLGDLKYWKISKIWFRKKIYLLEEFLRELNFTTTLSKWPYQQQNGDYHNQTCWQSQPDRAIKLTKNKKTIYKNWSFYHVYSDKKGIKLMDVRFRNVKIAFEISLEEVVSSYSGFSPYFQTMTSIESMYGIGNFISELSPLLDCPDNAQYYHLHRFVKESNTVETVDKAICVFSRRSTKPLRRHFEFFGPDPDVQFGSAVPAYLLYFRFIVTLFNYDYIFDYIFHDSGVIDIVVTPTGYVHVDSYGGSETFSNIHLTKFGYSDPALKLIYPIHQHMFFFKLDLDIIEKSNNFHIIDVVKNESQPMGQRVSVRDRLVEWENSSSIKLNCQHLHFYLICNDNLTSKCLQVINKSPVPDLISDEFKQSINWKSFQMAVSKRRTNESDGSSIFNGVNLSANIVDFSKFLSNNDYLKNEDLVVWIPIGSFHIPTIEDIPNTISSSNEMRISIKPFNLFDESPQGRSEQEFFTINVEDWKRGLRC